MQIHQFRRSFDPAGDRFICIRPVAALGPDTRRVHEMGLAADILQIARRTADDHGGGCLESVSVIVGDLAAVEPDLLAFAWQALVGASADAGARLDIDWRPARQHCAACGNVPERAAGSWLRLCPRCDGPLAVTGGDELEVRTVVFGTAAVAGGRG
jgi:hydrogenase nickel incorporation protein HypA/HybF